MSFRCDQCHTAVLPTTRMEHGFATYVPAIPHRVVVETRKKVYSERTYEVGNRTIHDPGGVGTEIVREHNLCADCAPSSVVAKRAHVTVVEPVLPSTQDEEPVE